MDDKKVAAAISSPFTDSVKPASGSGVNSSKGGAITSPMNSAWKSGPAEMTAANEEQQNSCPAFSHPHTTGPDTIPVKMFESHSMTPEKFVSPFSDSIANMTRPAEKD